MTERVPTAQRLAHEEPIAFEHEHGRLYDALEHVAQLAELAGHDILAAGLRRDRRDIAGELADRHCEPRTPPDTRRTATGPNSSAAPGGPE